MTTGTTVSGVSIKTIFVVFSGGGMVTVFFGEGCTMGIGCTGALTTGAGTGLTTGWTGDDAEERGVADISTIGDWFGMTVYILKMG